MSPVQALPQFSPVLGSQALLACFQRCCASEGLTAPRLPPVRTTIWISTPSALGGSHSFVHAACQGLWGGLVGAAGQYLPMSTALPLFFRGSRALGGFICRGLCSCSDLSCNQHESWCRVLFVPRENSRGHLHAAVCWEPALGACARKGASLGCSSERFHSNKARGCPRLPNQRCRPEDEGQTRVRSVIQSKQQFPGCPVLSRGWASVRS